MDTKPQSVVKICRVCKTEKQIEQFLKGRNICSCCNNEQRRNKYRNDEELRRKLIDNAILTKQKKSQAKKEQLLKEQEEIGWNNMECRYCFEIKPKDRFRHNRKKCRDCEREDPKEKFKRYVRTRIYNCLLHRKKRSHIEYLGCSTDDYINWISNYNSEYSLDNYGTVWHIDHVIPISKFNLESEEEQLQAFHWINTMPLSSKENLQKNNRIDRQQIYDHLQHVLKYHESNNLEFPNKFANLFATYLDAGTPLEP